MISRDAAQHALAPDAAPLRSVAAAELGAVGPLVMFGSGSVEVEGLKDVVFALAPIIVNFGEESYQAVYEIDDHAVFERINRNGRLPTTSAPGPGQFVEAYRQAFEAGAESILCFTVSAEVSATYKAALAAKEQFPGREIEVVDTRQLSISQGFMALAAAEAIEAGDSKEEALARARQASANAHLYAALPTLKYIAMSGRMSQVAAGIAGLLSIQPILSIKDGKLGLLEKARTRRRAWERVIALCAEAIGGKTVERFALWNVDAPGEALAPDRSPTKKREVNHQGEVSLRDAAR